MTQGIRKAPQAKSRKTSPPPESRRTQSAPRRSAPKQSAPAIATKSPKAEDNGQKAQAQMLSPVSMEPLFPVSPTSFSSHDAFGDLLGDISYYRQGQVKLSDHVAMGGGQPDNPETKYLKERVDNAQAQILSDEKAMHLFFDRDLDLAKNQRFVAPEGMQDAMEFSAARVVANNTDDAVDNLYADMNNAQFSLHQLNQASKARNTELATNWESAFQDTHRPHFFEDLGKVILFGEQVTENLLNGAPAPSASATPSPASKPLF